jgi:hypothetical protein
MFDHFRNTAYAGGDGHNFARHRFQGGQAE